jgi:hypothetical protein
MCHGHRLAGQRPQHFHQLPMYFDRSITDRNLFPGRAVCSARLRSPPTTSANGVGSIGSWEEVSTKTTNPSGLGGHLNLGLLAHISLWRCIGPMWHVRDREYLGPQLSAINETLMVEHVGHGQQSDGVRFVLHPSDRWPAAGSLPS